MNIQFNIHYQTRPGQSICVSGSANELGNWDEAHAFELQYAESGYWQGSLVIDEPGKQLKYKYLLKDQHGVDHYEWGESRILNPDETARKQVLIFDEWSWPGGHEKALYSSAFQRVIMPTDTTLKGARSRSTKQLEFRIKVPRIGNEFQLCLLGNQVKMGNWKGTKSVLMNYQPENGDWYCSLDLKGMQGTLEYKYGIFNTHTKKLVSLEEGSNREFTLPSIDQDQLCILKNDIAFRFPQGFWKGAGVSVPVFSLRSSKSFGIGEFNDLIPFIDWADSIGLKLVQILPVNETIARHDWLDSYPYKSISVVALHPVYLNLLKMGTLDDERLMEEILLKGQKLNTQQDVDYLKVMKLKSRYYKLLFDQEKFGFFESKSFKSFFKANKDWLVPYAAFAFLRDHFQTADFRKWGEYKNYDPKKMESFTREDAPELDDVRIHYFIQYHLDKQLSEVTDYAREKGIVLKGDIPIGISPNSVEAWTEPHLFNLEGQAGAPPDDFAVKGQNWGFPTYKWEEMAKEGFRWWKNRLQKMNQYFDAYRIDHILGFFRIWEIPMHAVEGVLGHFNPCLPLNAAEIESYEIYFDYERFIKPYIRYHILYDLFGMLMHDVIDKFLDEDGYDQFTFKEDFNTQQKINAHFLKDIEEEDLTIKRRKIRDGLFDLCSNVLFIQVGENQWHPRVNMQHTTSFQELDEHSRNKLNALYNHFYFHRHNDYWYKKGMEKLPAIISASNMLVCGEDLGMVPDCVPPVMQNLNILSLEIQRMPKDPSKEFAHPADAPYLSVCTPSTHDMSTIRGWWEENVEVTQRFYNEQLGNLGGAPYFAEPWICQQILSQHLYSTAMWAVFPIQDLLSIDGEFRWDETHRERINVPSDIRHHWKYRMHQSIESLREARDLNQLLKSLIESSDRNSDF